MHSSAFGLTLMVSSPACYQFDPVSWCRGYGPGALLLAWVLIGPIRAGDGCGDGSHLVIAASWKKQDLVSRELPGAGQDPSRLSVVGAEGQAESSYQTSPGS